jgi:hypothetical protein
MGEKSMARRAVDYYEKITGSGSDSRKGKTTKKPTTKPARSGNRNQNKQLKRLEKEGY